MKIFQEGTCRALPKRSGILPKVLGVPIRWPIPAGLTPYYRQRLKRRDVYSGSRYFFQTCRTTSLVHNIGSVWTLRISILFVVLSIQEWMEEGRAVVQRIRSKRLREQLWHVLFGAFPRPQARDGKTDEEQAGDDD